MSRPKFDCRIDLCAGQCSGALHLHVIPGLAYAVLPEVFYSLGTDVCKQLHFDPPCRLPSQADICSMMMKRSGTPPGLDAGLCSLSRVRAPHPWPRRLCLALLRRSGVVRRTKEDHWVIWIKGPQVPLSLICGHVEGSNVLGRKPERQLFSLCRMPEAAATVALPVMHSKAKTL